MRRVLHLLLPVLLLFGQEAAAQRLPFTVYTTAQGLVHNRCHGVRQDSLGYIWIGTDIGIARFDGRSFKYYPSPGAPFVAAPPVMVDKGWVVFGLNEHGPVRCLGDSVQHIRARGEKIGWLNGITTAPGGGYLLAQNRTGLLHVAADGTTRRVDSGLGVFRPHVLDLFRDSHGSLWITTDTGLLICPRGDLAHPRVHPYFTGLFTNIVREGPDGMMYVSCYKGLVRMPPVRSATDVIAQPQMLYPRRDVSGLAFAPDGIWCSTAPDGITHIRPDGRYTSYGIEAGLPAASAWDAYRDREGVLWFATENGLVKLARRDVVLADYSSYPHPGVKSGVALSDGGFLFGNNMVVQTWREGRFSAPQQIGEQPVFPPGAMVALPGGALWVNMNAQISQNNYYAYTRNAKMPGDRLVIGSAVEGLLGGPRTIATRNGVVCDKDDVWAIGDGKLLHYAGGRFTPMPLLNWARRLLTPTALCHGANAGDVWVLDSGRRLIRCMVERVPGRTAQLRAVEYLPENLLRGSAFSLVHCDHSGLVFVGGKEGLAICSKQRLKQWICAAYGKAGDATSSNWITAFAEDADGATWIGTTNGLDKYVRIPEQGYRIQRGLLRTELCGSYIFFVKVLGSRLFVGTTGCMAVVDLSHASLSADGLPPLVHLTGLRIGAADADSLLHALHMPRLRPNQNYLSFSFLGISFSNEQGIRYRYRLDGLDETWNGLTPEARATYSAIPPGRYTFRVEAQNAAGVWSAQPATFSFVVLQPFYTRWWFILLCVAVTGGILYGIYWYRLAQVLAIQRIRTKISKDLHDDIGATVSSIGILASFAGKNELKEEKRHQYLDTISDQSRYVAETLSDIVWAINPGNDSLEKLFARVLRYATELFEARGIEYTVEAHPDALRGLSLPMDARQNLYLLIKEAVNNLVKYSGATHASILVKREAGNLSVSIADDGKGFDPETTTGNGLPNMRKRAHALHGVLRIMSRKGGGGTRIELDIPLKAGARMM